MCTKPLNVFAAFILLVSSLVMVSSPADAKLMNDKSALRQMTNIFVGKAQGDGSGEWQQYPHFKEALDKVQPNQQPSTGPTLGGTEGGTTGGLTSEQQETSTSQTQCIGELPKTPYQCSGGMPNGNPFKDKTGYPYYDCTPETRSGVYPTPPPDPKKAAAPLLNAEASTPTPFGYSMLKDGLIPIASKGTNHQLRADQNSMQLAAAAKAAADLGKAPQSQAQNAKASAAGAAQGAADAMSDAFNPTWLQMLILSKTPLLNVANEATGAACSASQPIKTYENSVYLVQQAYKNVFLPMAVLLLLPGAVLTQMKGMISSGVLNNTNDEDAVNPFSGILKSVIAIFLIPATQLIVSYSIDVGNSLQYEVQRHINYLNIYMWGDEQVFKAPIENYENTIKPPSAFKVLGKLTEGPEKESGVASQSPATIMLQMLTNSTADAAAFGLVILCAFQIALACYLFLMGPIAAALYAWPTGAGSLFARVFANWTDAMINLALWRFWWCVVLLCIDTRLGWIAGLDVYTVWEMLMFLSFLIILTYVPFNPFDFKAGEMVSQIMSKADKAVGDATQK